MPHFYSKGSQTQFLKFNESWFLINLQHFIQKASVNIILLNWQVAVLVNFEELRQKRMLKEL